MKSSEIQAVTFDVGGTLVRPWPSVGEIYYRAAEGHGVRGLTPDKLNQRFGAIWKAETAFYHSRENWARLVDQVFEGLCHPKPSASFFPELYDYFAEPRAWRVYADVFPTLRALKRRKVTLGIVSNWDERLIPLLERLKLASYFQSIVVSCEVGACKPDARIFEAAKEQLRLPARAILHVGDDLERDVRGARNAGFQSCLLSRDKKVRGALRSLKDLL